MTIRQFFSGLLMKAARKMNPFLAAEFSPWELSRGRLADGDFDKMVKAYGSWVYRCASMNATSVAQVSLKLYVRRPAGGRTTREKGMKFVNHIPVTDKTYQCYLQNRRLKSYIRKDVEIEEIEEHPFLDLMKNVNLWRNAFDLHYETQLFLELTGNSYWYIRNNGLQVPAEVWVLPSNRITIVPDPVEFIARFELRRKGFGEPEKFDPSEIIHFRFPNPRDILYGMGPLMGAANAVDVNQYMRDYEQGLFENQGRPDLMVITKTGMTPDQRKRFEKQWREKFQGRKKAGKFGVLEGDLDIKELGFSPKEMSYLVGRKMTMQEICGIFGVPMSKVTTEDVNLANAKIGEYQYMKDTISPRLRLIEEKLNEKLMPLYPNPPGKLFCLFENPVPEDEEFRLKERESNLRTGYSSINQERQEDGQEEVPWGEVPLLPMNLMPISSSKDLNEILQRIKGQAYLDMLASNFPGGTTVPQEKKEFDDLVGDVAREIADNLNSIPGSPGPPETKDDEKLRERKWQIFIRRQNPYERKFITKLKELFGKQEAEVLANMKRTPKAVKADWEEDWLFNEALWINRFNHEGKPFIGGVLEDVGSAELADLAVGIDFDINNPRVQRWLGTRLEEYSKSVNGTTLDSIKRTLREGVAEGESIPKLRKRVQGVFEGCSKYRAQMISRTETITASNQGALEAFRQSGVVEKKEWLTAPGACEICLDNEAQGPIGLEESFNSGVSAPSAHPNCKCALLAVIEE